MNVLGKKRNMKERDRLLIDQGDETGQGHRTEGDRDHLVESQEIVTVEGIHARDGGHIQEKGMDIVIIGVDRHEIEEVTIDIQKKTEVVQSLLTIDAIDPESNVNSLYSYS